MNLRLGDTDPDFAADSAKVTSIIEKSQMSEPIILDLSGYSCSEALLEAKRTLQGLHPGEAIVFITDCQALRDDLHSWAGHIGNEITPADISGLGSNAFRVRVGNVPPRYK